jgi:hypothetical protein
MFAFQLIGSVLGFLFLAATLTGQASSQQR